MAKDVIQQEFRALEAIIASNSIPTAEKIRAMKMYERVMSKQAGITLRALGEVGDIVNFEGLSKQQVLNELRAVENVFVEGALNTAKTVNSPLTRKQAREIFSNYVALHFKVKIGRELKTQRRLRNKTAKGSARKARPAGPK